MPTTTKIYLTTNGYALCHRHAYEWVGAQGDSIIAMSGTPHTIAEAIGLDEPAECVDCAEERGCQNPNHDYFVRVGVPCDCATTSKVEGGKREDCRWADR